MPKMRMSTKVPQNSKVTRKTAPDKRLGLIHTYTYIHTYIHIHTYTYIHNVYIYIYI